MILGCEVRDFRVCKPWICEQQTRTRKSLFQLDSVVSLCPHNLICPGLPCSVIPLMEFTKLVSTSFVPNLCVNGESNVNDTYADTAIIGAIQIYGTHADTIIIIIIIIIIIRAINVDSAYINAIIKHITTICE